MTTARTTDDLLDSAYRVVRRLTPPDSPYAGLLARDEDEAVVLVDPAVVPGAARYSERGPHVLVPTDVACIGARQLLVFPWCVEPLSRVIAQRTEGIEPGEVVTIAISLCRGLAALRPHRGEEEASGSWWLTDSGRPVFALASAGARPMSEATREVWSALAGATTSPAIRDFLGRGDIDDVATPEALFALAEPTPLTMIPAAPRRMTSIPLRRDDTTDDFVQPGAMSAAWGRTVGRFIDPEWGMRTIGAVDALRHRWNRARKARGVDSASAPVRTRGSKSTRGRAAMWGALVAGVVLAAGLLWPGEPPNAEADGASRATPRSVTTPSPSPDVDVAALAEPSGSPSLSPTPLRDAGDPTTALGDLLGRAGQCDELSRCANVFEDPGQAAMQIELPSTPTSVTLLDDLGGVAIFRLGVASDPAGQGSIVVILAESADGWRIRDARALEAP